MLLTKWEQVGYEGGWVEARCGGLADAVKGKADTSSVEAQISEVRWLRGTWIFASAHRCFPVSALANV